MDASQERELLIQRALAREELNHREIDARCAERVVAHDRGPMYWLRKITKTDNFQWMDRGLEPIAPFPYKPHKGFDHDYMDVVMGYFLEDKIVCVPKTREMMTSWLMVGYITWMCQFFPNVEWISQSEKESKAADLIKYANSLYKNQPDWLRDKHPLAHGRQEGSSLAIAWANGSKFRALPQGVRQLASSHPHGYFMDEAAHLEEAEACFNIAQPAVRQIVMVSSPSPSWFGIICDPNLAV